MRRMPSQVSKRDDHEFRELLSVLKNEEHAWINLYSFYQLSKSGPPDYVDMVDVVREIVDAARHRVVWGSNWPHAGISVPMPNDGISSISFGGGSR